MTELGPTERRLLRALHAADEPSQADRARVRTRLLVKLGAATGVGAAAMAAAGSGSGATAAGAATGAGAASVAPGAAVTATATGVAGWAATLKIGSAVAVVAATAGGAAWIATAPHASGPPPVHQVQHTAPAGVKPSTGADSARRESSASNARPGRVRSRPAEPPGGAGKADDLEGELSLLENAQQALKAGDSERALAELDRHATEHPGGALATERAGVRAVALCEAGKLSEGRREARRFLSKNPKSPLAVRVRAACLNTKK